MLGPLKLENVLCKRLILTLGIALGAKQRVPTDSCGIIYLGHKKLKLGV